MSSPSPPHVAVIIPCYNEVRTIEQKLRNTLAFTYPSKTVVVVDDYSTDQTFERAQAAAGQGVLVLRNVGRPGKNSAVATALKCVPSDLICLTDADVLVPPDALSTLVACFRDERIGAACCKREYLTWEHWQQGELRPTSLGLEDRMADLLHMLENRLDSVVLPYGEFLVFRRTGDDAVAEGIRGDDVEIGLRTRARGQRVVYIATTQHFGLRAEERGGYVRQRYRRGQAVQDRLLRRRRMLFNPRYGWFGAVCFPLEFLLFVIQPLFVFMAAGMTMLMVMRFALSHAGSIPLLFIGAVVLGLMTPARGYLAVNVLLFGGLVARLTGQPVSDRWIREAPGAPDRAPAIATAFPDAFPSLNPSDYLKETGE